jgi:hypothetical protein
VYPYKRFILGSTLRGWTQHEIADYLWCSQPTVSYIVSTTVKRCSQYQGIPKPSWNEIQAALAGLDKQTQEVMMAMWRHRQQVAAANHIQRSQGYVRYRFLQGLKQIDGKVADWLKLSTVIEPRFEFAPEFFTGQLPKACPTPKSLISLAELVREELSYGEE